MSLNPSSSGGGGSNGPCGACKFLQRKCVRGCIFAPYFDAEKGAAHFAAVHKVFGASNVSKLLLHIPVHKRLDAAVTICYEAQARLRDPVYGCVARIFTLQQQVVYLQAELSYLQTHLATLELPMPPPLPLPPLPVPTIVLPVELSISDIPMASFVPAIHDSPALFDPMAQSSWAVQHRSTDSHHLGGGSGPLLMCGSIADGGSGSVGDLQAITHEILQICGSPQAHLPYSHASS